ncbi:MAG TPA: DUF29 domain-containing protein [Geminicoccaceae bacterium]|nr:DUF29 domain-containing protein [Geminicoccaceae bacterium]
MATRIKPATAKDLYDEDFYVWTGRQADLLRARRFDELDLENLIEEVGDLGGALKSSVLNNARVIMEHLLKLQFSPATDPRTGWAETVVEHRTRLESDLTPRLRQILADELPRLYALTRRGTERKLRLHGEHAAAEVLPADCPYTPDQITGDWWP